MARNNLKYDADALELMAKRFRILGDPLRLKLLQILGEGELSVGDLVQATASTQPNISKHLRQLQEVGLLERRQEKNTVYYNIADTTIFDVCSIICAGAQKRLTQQAQALSEHRAELAKPKGSNVRKKTLRKER